MNQNSNNSAKIQSNQNNIIIDFFKCSFKDGYTRNKKPMIAKNQPGQVGAGNVMNQSRQKYPVASRRPWTIKKIPVNKNTILFI